MIADLWTPDIWIPSIREKKATFPAIFGTGVVVSNPQLDALASGGGVSGNVPVWKDITDQDDEIQVEDTAPVNTNKITAGVMVAPITNRVYKAGGSALAAAGSFELIWITPTPFPWASFPNWAMRSSQALTNGQ